MRVYVRCPSSLRMSGWVWDLVNLLPRWFLWKCCSLKKGNNRCWVVWMMMKRGCFVCGSMGKMTRRLVHAVCNGEAHAAKCFGHGIPLFSYLNKNQVITTSKCLMWWNNSLNRLSTKFIINNFFFYYQTLLISGLNFKLNKFIKLYLSLD